MKRALLLVLALTLQSLAADKAPSNLVVAEYRVSYEFVIWLDESNRYPQGFLSMAGANFPPGAFATYIAASNRILVRQTPRFHKAFELLVEQWRRNGGKTRPNPTLLEILRAKDVASTK